MNKFLLFSFVCLIFMAFASNNVEKSNLNKVFVTNTTRVDILPTDSIQNEIDEYNLLEINFQSKKDEQSLSATAYIHADNQGMDIVLLNDLGIELGVISYDGMNAVIDSKIIPKKLKAEYVILDFQNTFADFDILKKHYEKYNLDFKEIVERCITPDNETFYVVNRILSKKEKIIETITKDTRYNSTTIKNHLRNYEYKLTKSDIDE